MGGTERGGLTLATRVVRGPKATTRAPSATRFRPDFGVAAASPAAAGFPGTPGRSASSAEINRHAVGRLGDLRSVRLHLHAISPAERLAQHLAQPRFQHDAQRVERADGPFRIADIQRACPGVSVDLIRQVLKDLRARGAVECLGRGRQAAWRKTGPVN